MMKEFEHKRQSVGQARRVEIFKQNGQVHLRMHRSFLTSSESNFLYVHEYRDGKKHPLGYFGRLAEARFQNNTAFHDPRIRKLYARIANTLHSGVDVVNLEEDHPLPTLEQLRDSGFVSCDMQDHLSFDVDIFEQKTPQYLKRQVDLGGGGVC